MSKIKKALIAAGVLSAGSVAAAGIGQEGNLEERAAGIVRRYGPMRWLPTPT